MKPTGAFLIEPNAAMKDEFLAMVREFETAGENFYENALADFPAYLEKLKNNAKGLNLPPDRVPGREFWLVDNGKIVARSKLRDRLTPALEDEGGHIGYDVRSSERRKGYGELLLKLTLEKAKNAGLEKVLLTCDTDNTGSAKIIEKNGGKLDSRAVSKKSGKEISRYWIEI